MPWRHEEKTPTRPEEILDELERVIKNAKPVPLTDQVRVDARTLEKLIEQLRRTL
jgi:hypothetical protein